VRRYHGHKQNTAPVFFRRVCVTGFALHWIYVSQYAKTKHNKVRTGKDLSDNFHIQNGLKQGNALKSLLFSFSYNMPLGKSRETKLRRNQKGHFNCWSMPMM
jgi:hypothetical protein